MKKSKLRLLALVGTTAVAAAVAVPLASGHATISLLQPQGSALTGKSGTWVIRVPNERDNRSTFKVTATIPDPVQGSFTIRQSSQWKATIQRNAAGTGVAKVTWQARTGDDQIHPGEYGIFEVRFTNPATPQQLCFAFDQWYNGSAKGVAPELVSWSGAAGTATPASCVNIVAS